VATRARWLAIVAALALSLLPPVRAGAAGKAADYGTAFAGAGMVGAGEKGRAEDHARHAPAFSAAAANTTATGIVNVSMCAAAANQMSEVLLPDGAGGGILVWQDARTGEWDVYAQQIDLAGDTHWVPDGVPVCKAGGAQTVPQAVSDGAGGVIVAWQDARAGALDIYAQRLNATGATLWTVGGVPVCAASADQRQPVLVGDGHGGAVVAWVDDRSGASDVYAQRLNASGVAQWATNGVAVCTASGVQQEPAMVSDGQGGGIVVWQDRRSGTGDIYAGRVSESGVATWGTSGVALCAAVGEQEKAAAVADGAGGAMVGWEDLRGASRDVYGQRVNASGAVQWGADGVAACVAGGDQVGVAIGVDGAGGALLVWQDGRPGAQGQEIYGQRVNGAGVAQWTANGVGVCVATGDQVGPALAADPMGGVVVAWSDARNAGSGTDIYVQHVSVSGAGQWTAGGVRVCDAASTQDAARVIADGVGGASVVWRDFRAGATSDLYGQHVDAGGQVTDQCLTTTNLVLDTPVTSASAQSYYTLEQDQFYWCGVGVRGAAGSDWDLEVYQPVTFGMSRYPTCFSGPLAGSFAASGVDFVVGDFNIGHTEPVFPGAGYGVRAFRYTGTGSGTVEWDGDANTMSKDCGTGGNCGAKSSNNWSGMLDVWDVYLFGLRRYTFSFARTGSADIKFLLFGSTGTTGTFFAPRSGRLFETTAPTWEFIAPDTGWYAVVLVNDNGLTGTYQVTVATGPVVGVSGMPPIQTRLEAVAPNPSTGPVLIQYALAEPAAAGFDVFDMAGRMVARIPEERREPGAWSARWEGLTHEGRPAPPGIYFVQMRVNGRRAGLSRIALVR
jgi:hypothetical protein